MRDMERKREKDKGYHAVNKKRYATDAKYRRHRKEIIKRHQENKDNFLKNVKVQFGCSECEEDHYAALVFHHVDPGEKDHNLSQIQGLGWGRILKELEKCEVMCRNCHSKYHAREMPISQIRKDNRGTAKMKQEDFYFPKEYQGELNL